MASVRGTGAERVLNKLKKSVEAGNYYEAHQMYRTLYFRYLGQEKYEDLLSLLYDGATLLLSHDQQSSGGDLAKLFIEVLEKGLFFPTEVMMERLGKLLSLMSPGLVERQTFLASALKWSAKQLESSQQQKLGGHPYLHRIFAQTLWDEGNHMQARYHFLRSCDSEGFASMLIELHIENGYSQEVDLFIAQAVLQCLCLQPPQTAQNLFQSYTQQHPNIGKGPPFRLPLLNFIWLLLLTIESKKLTAFTVLCEQYQPSLKRDPTYRDYLDKIGQLFFGVPPPRPQQQGILGNLLQSLMSGMGGDESDSDTESRGGGSSSAAGVAHNLQPVDLD